MNPTILFEWKCMECGIVYWLETIPFDSETCFKCSGAMTWTNRELTGELKVNEDFELALSEQEELK